MIGRECGVERHIQIFKRLGIWNEDGNTTPKCQDIITFNWDCNITETMALWIIGSVESVSNGIIHTIEGNSNNQVRRNTLPNLHKTVICNPTYLIKKKPQASFHFFNPSETLGRGLDGWFQGLMDCEGRWAYESLSACRVIERVPDNRVAK